MNVAAIAMSVNLFNNNDKPMVPPTKSIHNHANIDGRPETSVKNIEDDSILSPPSNTPSTVDGGSNREEDSSNEQEEHDDFEDSEKVNGTGLTLYATPMATKAPYWKRRMGWKPNMARIQRSKLRNLFRVPVRRHATVGFSDTRQGDALLAVSNKKSSKSWSTRAVDGDERMRQVPREERTLEPEKDYDIVNDANQVEDTGWNAFHAVNHELVFV